MLRQNITRYTVVEGRLSAGTKGITLVEGSVGYVRAVSAHNSSGTAHSDIRTALAAKKNISDGMTATAYAAITTKDDNTLFLIVGE